jgi:uncharacterized protein
MPGMKVTVIKRNPKGEETWRYQGRLIRKEGNTIVIEALFNRPDTFFMEITIKEGDRFVETFYTDRWYNTFEIHDREDGRIKGWYGNIGKPAVWEAHGQLAYIDLALDLWVGMDGKMTVLDEDEFEVLGLDEETVSQARRALEELQGMFTKDRNGLRLK